MTRNLKKRVCSLLLFLFSSSVSSVAVNFQTPKKLLYSQMANNEGVDKRSLKVQVVGEQLLVQEGRAGARRPKTILDSSQLRNRWQQLISSEVESSASNDRQTWFLTPSQRFPEGLVETIPDLFRSLAPATTGNQQSTQRRLVMLTELLSSLSMTKTTNRQWT